MIYGIGFRWFIVPFLSCKEVQKNVIFYLTNKQTYKCKQLEEKLSKKQASVETRFSL